MPSLRCSYVPNTPGNLLQHAPFFVTLVISLDWISKLRVVILVAETSFQETQVNL